MGRIAGRISLMGRITVDEGINLALESCHSEANRRHAHKMVLDLLTDTLGELAGLLPQRITFQQPNIRICLER